MGYQTAPHGSLHGPPLWIVPLTEGTVLFFESEWVLYPAFSSPPPIESIRDITGAEKKPSKNQQHPSSL